MKKNIVKTIFCLSIIMISAKAAYQKPTIQAFIDSSKIMIGEQTQIHLKINVNKNQIFRFPIFRDTLTSGIEIVSISKPDTIFIKKNQIQVQYSYRITSFDSAKYTLPSFHLIVKKDTFHSNKLFLLVASPNLRDTVANNFYDIKNIFPSQCGFSDYLNIIWCIVGICIAILIWYYFSLSKKEKKILPFKKKSKISISSHVRAIKALDEIKKQQLWQRGKEREYHSQISDVIRRYISDRFFINAMEMTSEETLHAIKFTSEVQFVLNDLQQLLHLADLVKFAKYCPLAKENELSITNAYSFINGTILNKEIQEK